MKLMSVWEQLEVISVNLGSTPEQVCRDASLSISTMYELKSGSSPSKKTKAKIEEALDLLAS